MAAIATQQVPQHLEALARANRVRLERAELCRGVEALDAAAGQEALAELILDPPTCCASLTLGEALEWPHRWGRSRAQRLIRGVTYRLGGRGRTVVGLEESRLDALTVRERRAVAEGLGVVIEAAS